MAVQRRKVALEDDSALVTILERVVVLDMGVARVGVPQLAAAVVVGLEEVAVLVVEEVAVLDMC